jgi:chromosome segregation ATPase
MSIDPEVIGLLCAIIGGAIAWGAERQARKDLERRHAEAMADVRPRITRAEEQIATWRASHDTLEERMRGLKEQLDRIEGMLSSVTTARVQARRRNK